MAAVAGCTISGPGVDRNGYPSPGVAVSVAQNLATRSGSEVTLYVRDQAGAVVARVERDRGGTIYTYAGRRES